MADDTHTDLKPQSVDNQSWSADSTMAFSTNLNLSVGLPRFGGDSGSFARFVEDFSIFARLQRWEDDKKCDVFPLCLSGIARDAYDALSPDQKASFDLTVAGLQQSFSGRTPIDHHMSLTTLKYDPTEPLDAFVIELRMLVSRAFPGQEQDGLLFNHFLMSLPDDYRVQVVAAGIMTFDAAVAKVRNLNSALRVRAAGVRQLSAAPDVVAQLQRRIEELERRLEAGGPSRGGPPPGGPSRGGPQPGGPGRADRGGSPAGGPGAAGNRRACFACGQPGHIRSVCRHRAAVCYRCGERGHLANMCRARTPEN